MPEAVRVWYLKGEGSATGDLSGLWCVDGQGSSHSAPSSKADLLEYFCDPPPTKPQGLAHPANLIPLKFGRQLAKTSKLSVWVSCGRSQSTQMCRCLCKVVWPIQQVANGPARKGFGFQRQGCIQGKRFQVSEVITCNLVSSVMHNSDRGSVTGSKPGSRKLHMSH